MNSALTTQDSFIVAPESEIAEDLLAPHLLAAGVIGGVPAIAGAWLGGFAVSPLWATLFLAVGAGAIFQMVWQIARVMYATGLLVTD